MLDAVGYLRLNWVRATMPRVATAYLGAIAGAEVLVARGDVGVGIACDAVLIVALLNHYVWLGARPQRRVLVALALLPLLRLLSVTMTVPEAPYFDRYLLTGLPLLAAACLTARALGLTPGDLGLRLKRWPAQVAITLTGVPLSLAAYVLVHPQPLIARFDGPHLAAAAATLGVCVALVEELVFRGLLQHVASPLFGRLGLLFSAAAFVSMYTGSSSPSYAAFMGVVGLFFGWCVQRTGSLWGVVLAHGGLIVGMTCVWPFIWS